MPSPIGHAIAGAAIAWSVDGTAVRRWSLTLVCVGLAAAPDLDLLAPYPHRTVTHSFLALALITILAIVVTGKVTGRVQWRIVCACAAAYGSHLLLDWLAEDWNAPRGLQLLWPFSDRWFISNLDLFRGTARPRFFELETMRTNVIAILQEIAILGPVAWVIWWAARRRTN